LCPQVKIQLKYCQSITEWKECFSYMNSGGVDGVGGPPPMKLKISFGHEHELFLNIAEYPKEANLPYLFWRPVHSLFITRLE